MKYLIVNPTAGHGKAGKLAAQVAQTLQEVRMEHTRFKGHATALARAAAQSGLYDCIIAMGGDGTVAEVAEGLRDSGIPMGILPAGTGNDAARGYHIPLKLKDAMDNLQTGIAKYVDCIKIQDRYFLNVISVGFDAQVLRISQKYKYLGAATYAYSACRILARYRWTDLHITVDGQAMRQKCFLTAVGNGSFYGGNMKVLPPADPTDGWLDLCMIDSVPLSRSASFFPRFIKGQHLGQPEAHFLRAKHVIIEAPEGTEAFDYNADGDLFEHCRRLEIQVQEKRLQIIMP